MNQDELIHGFVDGELTQQEEQQMRQLLDADPEVRRRVEAYGQIKEAIQSAPLKEPDLSSWEDVETPPGASSWRALGLSLFFFGYLGLVAIGLHDFFTGPEPMSSKVMIGSLLVGVGVLLISVIRQRLIELKTDRYQRVEK